MWTPRRHSSQTCLKEQTERHSLTDKKPSAITRYPESEERKQPNDDIMTELNKKTKKEDVIKLRTEAGSMKFKVYRDKDIGLSGYSDCLIGQVTLCQFVGS